MMVFSRSSSSGPYSRQPFAERAGLSSFMRSYTRSARTVSPVRLAHSAAERLSGWPRFVMERSVGYDARSGSSPAMQLVEADVHAGRHVQGLDGLRPWNRE